MLKTLNTNKNKKTVILSALFVFVTVYLLYNIRRVFYGALEFMPLFCVFSLFLAAAVGVSIWLIFKKQKNFITVLVAWAIGLSFVYLVIFPPYTVPDELTHYLSAYRMSNYFLFDFSQASNESLLIRACDQEYLLGLDRNVSADYIKSVYSQASFFADNTVKIEWLAEDAGSNAPFGYLFSAFGIALARLLHLSPFCTFLFGRVINIAAFNAMLIFAVKRMPIGKLAVLSVSLLPIVLHLVASFSYDSVTIAYAFCFIAQVMHIKNSQTVASKKDVALLLLFSLVLAPSKLVYLPVIFVMLIIPAERFGANSKKANIIKFSVLIITFVIFMLLQVSTFMSTVNDTSTGLGTEPAYSLSWIFQNPLEALIIMRDTFKTFGQDYINQMFSKTLGWLNVDVPLTICAAFATIIIISFLKRSDETFKVEFTEKVWITLCIIGSVFLVMLSMFIAVTPNNCPVILGVQGRYFIPLMIPAYLVLRNKFITVNKGIDKYIAAALIAISAISASEVFTLVVSPIIT